MLQPYCEFSHISEAESLEGHRHLKSSRSAVTGERKGNCFGMIFWRGDKPPMDEPLVCSYF